jgi:hypothetical protein
MGGPEQFVKCDKCGSTEIADNRPFGEDMVAYAITETR